MKSYSFCFAVGLAAYSIALAPATAQDTPPPESAPPTATPPVTTDTPPATTDSPEETTGTAADSTEAPADPLSVSPAPSFFFGVPDRPTAWGQVGYSGVLRGGYVFLPGENLSIGGEFILDAGFFNSVGTGRPGTVSIAVAAPIKLKISESDTMIIGLTGRPGIGITLVDSVETDFGDPNFGQSKTEPLFALLLHVEGNVGFKINDDFIVGGGVEIPVTFLFGTFNIFLFPLLAGPVAEYRITDDIAVHADFKIGPHLAAGDSSTSFGLKFQAGASWAF